MKRAITINLISSDKSDNSNGQLTVTFDPTSREIARRIGIEHFHIGLAEALRRSFANPDIWAAVIAEDK